MSYNALELVRKHNFECFPIRQRSSLKFIMFTLANYADVEFVSFPSFQRIADDTCLNKTTVKKLIYQLVEQNYLIKTLRFRENGSQTSNTYQINLAVLGCDDTPHGGSDDKLHGGSDDTLHVGGCQDNTALNHQLDPKLDPKIDQSLSSCQKAKNAFLHADKMIEIYNEIMSSHQFEHQPAKASWTPARQEKLKAFWNKRQKSRQRNKESEYSLELFRNYLLKCVHQHPWMFSKKINSATGSLYARKNLDFFLQEKTYISVKEDAWNDIQK